MRTQRRQRTVACVCGQDDQVLPVIWMLLLATLLIWGCSATDAFAEIRSISDSSISEAVKDALMADPGVNASLIDVEANDGIVTVSGTVNNLLAKDRATKSDWEIKEDIDSELFGAPSLTPARSR